MNFITDRASFFRLIEGPSLIRYNQWMTPGEIIRDARRRHGISQEKLAFRAGTRQSAVSRLERDEVSPSVETMGTLLRAMGESFEIGSKPVERAYDPLHLRAMKARPADERLALAISWNRTAGRFAEAGRTARAGGSRADG
ncbi:MAG: helix-turn-helix transcriptional regulator [Solirubrobacterales bacterium]|nr:helix-turn-helix transcriptional regulator [Solirubrobacterales bacterium]